MSDYDRGKRYDSTRDAWESIWQETADMERELTAVQSRRSMQTINAYLPFLPKDKPILEAGSGMSAVVITLREMGYNIIGLDYAEKALHTSRAYDPKLQLLVGDVHELPHATNSLGAYLSFGVLEHFEHGMVPALREAYRVLDVGGTLILTIPYPNVVWKLAQWRREQRGETLIDDEFYESTHTQHQLTSYCEEVGFKVVKAIPTSHSFTLWGLHGIFRGAGYYETNALSEGMGDVLRVVAPWAFNFMTLIIAQK